MISIVIPTYNEAENIAPLINQILKLDKRFSIIIVDDNSPDSTGKIAERLRKNFPKRVFVIHHSGKAGLGTAYVAGFKKALDLGSDLIFSMDADFSHNPKALPFFVKKINSGFDLVLGSRYVKGGGVSWTGFRLFLSKGANAFARFMLGIPIHDFTTGFRCYRRKVLESLNLTSIKSSGYSFLEEVLFLCYKKGFRIGEVPIFFKDRIEGNSKLGKKEILNFFLTVVRLKLSKP